MVKKSIALMFILALVGCDEDTPTSPTSPSVSPTATVATNVSTPTPGNSPTVNDSEPAPNLVDPVDTPLYSIVGPGGCLEYTEHEWTVTVNEEGYRLRTASFHENDAGCSPTTRKGGGAVQIVSEMNPGPTVFQWHGNQACGRYQADIAIGDEATGNFETIVGVVINTGVDCVAEEVIPEEPEVEEPPVVDPGPPPIMCDFSTPTAVTIQAVSDMGGADKIVIHYDIDEGLTLTTAGSYTLQDFDIAVIDADDTQSAVFDWDEGPGNDWMLLAHNMPANPPPSVADITHGTYNIAVEYVLTGEQFLITFSVAVTYINDGIEMTVSNVSACPYDGTPLPMPTLFPEPTEVCYYYNGSFFATAFEDSNTDLDALWFGFDPSNATWYGGSSVDDVGQVFPNDQDLILFLDVDYSGSTSNYVDVFDIEAGPYPVRWLINSSNLPSDFISGTFPVDDVTEGNYFINMENLEVWEFSFTVSVELTALGSNLMTLNNLQACVMN